VPAMQQIEAYFGRADKFFDVHSNFASEGTGKFLQGAMKAFANWIESVRCRPRGWRSGRPELQCDAQKCTGRSPSNSSRQAWLKPSNRSIVPSMAISRSSTKLLSGSR
jgi:hypothetical protein